MFNSIFDHMVNYYNDTYNTLKETEKEFKDEWIWVEGWKATDYYMRGYGNFQFKLKEVFKLEENENPEKNNKGFHFCLHPSYIQNYYFYGRLFKVRALVKKSDYIKAQKYINGEEISIYKEFSFDMDRGKKLVSKAIEFIEEIPISEARKYFKKAYFCDTDEEYLDFIKWKADGKKAKDFYFPKFSNIMKKIELNDLLIKVIWNRVALEESEDFINYALALKESEISKDLFIYLLVNYSRG